MKNKTQSIALLLLAILNSSCKKNKKTDSAAADCALTVVPTPTVTPTTTPTYLNFSQFNIGTYWVYQRFNIDGNGNATPTSAFDSCYVEKDTVINNKTYLKIIRPTIFSFNKEVLFEKDSLHYVVNQKGNILFSSQDFSSVLETSYNITGVNDTVYKMVKQMADKNAIVLTPSGTFTTSNAKESYLFYPNWPSSGNPRIRNKRYAENIGIVIETLSFIRTDPSYVERRLVRYHIN